MFEILDFSMCFVLCTDSFRDLLKSSSAGLELGTLSGFETSVPEIRRSHVVFVRLVATSRMRWASMAEKEGNACRILVRKTSGKECVLNNTN